MGMSTDGQLCYGVRFDEGFEFPWADKDIEDWWRDTILGFKPSIEIFDSNGEYLNGKRPSDEQIDAFFEERKAFSEKNKKLPVELVNYCSGDYPSYILAIPGSCKTANRGYPCIITDADMKVDAAAVEALRAFLKEFELTPEGEEGWYLSSYLG